MSNNPDNFINCISELLQSAGFGFSQIFSETQGLIEISTQQVEDPPVDEKILIELDNPIFSPPNIVSFSSVREKLFNDPGLDGGFSLLMLRQNSQPYHAHWAIFEENGEKYLAALAIANLDVINTDLITAIILSLLRRRIEYRSLLKNIVENAPIN